MSPTNDNLQQKVLDELRDEPSLEAAHIGVTADKGVVTLTGSVTSYAEKLIAEEAAKRVLGVRAVANDVQVQLPDGHARTDTEIAQAAVDALRWHSMVPDEWVKVTVDKGWVTLEGTVDWKYQKDAAEHAVRHLTGVKAATNAITVTPTTPLKVGEVKHRIFEAFRRNAELRRGASASTRTTTRSYCTATCTTGRRCKKRSGPHGRRPASPKWTTASSSSRKRIG